MRALCLASLCTFWLACGGPSPANDPAEPDLTSIQPPEATESAEVEDGAKMLEVGNQAGAKAAFAAALKKNPRDAEAHYYLGLLAEQGGDAAGAEREYKAALAIKPGLEQAAVNLSAAYLEAGRWDDAAAVLGPARKASPQSGPLAANHALVLAQQGNMAGAKAAFAQAEKASPNDPSLLLLEAEWLTRWKELGPAKDKLLAAKAHAGDDPAQLAAVAFGLKNAGAFAECVGTLDAAVGKLGTAKGAGELRVLRGLCKLGQKDEAGATADFAEARKVEPTFAAGHYYWAGRQAEAGKWADAEAGYAKYLELAPQGELAGKAKERLEAIKQKKSGKAPKKK